MPFFSLGTITVDIRNYPTAENIQRYRPLNVDVRFSRFANEGAVEPSLVVLYEQLYALFADIFSMYTPAEQDGIIAIFEISLQPVDMGERTVGSTLINPFRFQSFNPARIASLISEWTQSGDEYELTDFSFHFMFDVRTYLFGSGNTNPLASPFSKVDKGTDETQRDESGDLSCLAVALGYNMARYEKRSEFEARRETYHKSSPNLGFDRLKRRSLELARQLMVQFGWEVSTPSSAIQKFVEAYPQFRVGLFYRGVDRAVVFKSTDYELELYNKFD